MLNEIAMHHRGQSMLPLAMRFQLRSDMPWKLDEGDIQRQKEMFEAIRSLPDPLASIHADMAQAVLDIDSQSLDIDESARRMELFRHAAIETMLSQPAGASDDFQERSIAIMTSADTILGIARRFHICIDSWIRWKSTHF